MVSLLIDGYDLENGKCDNMILNQVKSLCKRVSPDSKFNLVRVTIGVKKVSMYN